MNPVPILFVDHAHALGGAENSLKLLLKHLDPKHWQLHLACPKGPLAMGVKQLNVTIHTLQFPKLRRSLRSPFDWWQGIYGLSHIARTINARAVISNTIRATIYACPAAKIAKTAFVWTMRDFWLSESKPQAPGFDSLSKRILCKMTNAVIANSYATAGHLPCKSKTTVIHNGIDIEHYTPSSSRRQASRAGFNLPDDVFILGMVGRLRPWKGQNRLLRVLKYVLEKHPHTQCMIVGGAPFKSSEKYIAQLHQLVRDLDLLDRVTFTGQLDDVRPALSAMDVFVHPGDPEPFGLVNIEAMAMEKPVVAFAHGALPEIVEHGETGLLTPPFDEKAMAQAISELINNPSQRNAMGNAGRRRVEQIFSITNTARAVDKVLNTIV